MLLLGCEHDRFSLKRKRLTLPQVNSETRVEIVKMALDKTHTHKEIADLFNVRTAVVSQLTSALKRSKSTIAKRRVKELKR